jgi:hypothetical protein
LPGTEWGHQEKQFKGHAVGERGVHREEISNWLDYYLWERKEEDKKQR